MEDIWKNILTWLNMQDSLGNAGICNPAYRIILKGDVLMRFTQEDSTAYAECFECKCGEHVFYIALTPLSEDGIELPEPILMALAEVRLEAVLKAIGDTLGIKCVLVGKCTTPDYDKLVFSLEKNGDIFFKGGVFVDDVMRTGLFDPKWLDLDMLADEKHDFYVELPLELQVDKAVAGDYILLPELAPNGEENLSVVLRSDTCVGCFQANLNKSTNTISLLTFQADGVEQHEAIKYQDCVLPITLAQLQQLDDGNEINLTLPEVSRIAYGDKLVGKLTTLTGQTALLVE